MKRSSVGLFCGVAICVIAASLSGSGFIPLSEIIVPTNLTSLSLKKSLPALSLMDLWWQRSIEGIGDESSVIVCLGVLEVCCLPHTHGCHRSAIRIVALEPSSADVSLMWNSSGAIVIPNGRPNNLYLPCDVCMVVILEDSSSRGIWRKPLISTRGNHFAERSLWSCSFRVGIECFGRWMALFTVWLGSMNTRNFPDDGKCEKYMGIRVVSCLLVEYWMTTFTYRWPCWSLYPCLTIS